MLRSVKAEQIESIKAKFAKMTSAVFVDFQGMTVEEVTKLRDDLRAKGVEYKVIKNKRVKHAFKGEAWMGKLEGEVLDGKAVQDQLANMPGKNEARAMLLATLQAPAQRLVMLLNTPGGNFVRALKAKEAKG